MDNENYGHQQRLLIRKQDLFAEVASRVLQVLPEATSIWCFGLNAISADRLNPHDWDFIAMLPLTAQHSHIEAMNQCNSPLDQIRRINNDRIDIQALRVDENSSFVTMLRKEGFVIWRDGHLVEPDQHTLARTA